MNRHDQDLYQQVTQFSSVIEDNLWSNAMAIAKKFNIISMINDMLSQSVSLCVYQVILIR